MKVYVVTKDNLENNTFVVAVFFDEKQANELCRTMNNKDPYNAWDAEEFEVRGMP